MSRQERCTDSFEYYLGLSVQEGTQRSALSE